MAGAKETPRQKMIGLMYLVLMALLAMNVSKEVINSFVTLSNNMEVQNTEMALSNGQMINQLFAKASGGELNEQDKKALMEIHQKSVEIHDMTRSLANFYMESAQVMLNEGQEGDWLYNAGDGFMAVKDLVLHEYEKKDDYDIPTRLFVGNDHHNITESGKLLVSKMEHFRDSLCMLFASKTIDGKTYYFDPVEVTRKDLSDSSYLQTLEVALETVLPKDRAVIKEVYRLLTLPDNVENHGEMYPWQAGQFDHAPIVAASAIFTSLKGRVLQAEKIILNNFNDQNDVPIFKFNKIEPLAFSSSSYINVGDSLNMAVMVAAFDSTSNTQIRYWLDDTLRTPDNMLESSLNNLKLGGGVGDHVVVGDIAVNSKHGIQWRPFTYKYSVGSPNATVSASDLNVLYANGWKNNIEVSAGGYDPSTISVTGSNCTIAKEGGKYVVVASQVGGTASLKVTARDADGNSVLLTSKEFRIMSLPKPEPFFAGQSFDKPTISKTLLGATDVIGCGVKDPILNVKYKVEGFSMLVKSASGGITTLHSSTNKMTSEMITAKNALKKGQTLNITNVKASINGGGKFPIGNLTFIVE